MPETAGTGLDERKIFQNYKQLQFIDTLALYFNRIHPSERAEQEFEKRTDRRPTRTFGRHPAATATMFIR